MKCKRILSVMLLVLVTLAVMSGCGSKVDKVSDFNEGALGVVTGSLYDGFSRALYPKAEIKYHKNFADVLNSLKQGKVDGCMLDEPNYNALKRTSPTLSCTDVPEYDVEIGFGFQKNTAGYAMQAEMNELLNELRNEGRLEALIEKWYGEAEPTDELNRPDFSKNTKKIKICIDSTRKPFVYLKNGNYVGFEVEVVYLFCEKYGYNPTFEDVSFASGIMGLSEGKYDLVAGGLYMTPERKESVNFSEPYMYADVVMVTNNGDEDVSFIANIKDGFNKTFINEGRWKLIVEGIDITLLITVCSAICGTLLGFIVYMLCRIFGKVAVYITEVFTVITNGTPAVVILMILYYVIFGNTDISGIIVSIIGFSLTTGAFVYEKLTVSVNGIEVGQTEAALAMGFTDNGTFFNVLLPQALKFFLPLYKAQVGTLIQATAVVGYIAVEDLTQMSDIIRSNTYEAFFPLVSSAIIYLILTFAISELIQLIIYKFEPKNRSRAKILKGVVVK